MLEQTEDIHEESNKSEDTHEESADVKQDDSEEKSVKSEQSQNDESHIDTSSTADSEIKNQSERILEGNNDDVKIFYAIKTRGNDKASNPDETIDNKISTTLKGRYYLSIILKFEDVDRMKDFEKIKAMLSYNDGHKEEFIFFLKPDLKKRQKV